MNKYSGIGKAYEGVPNDATAATDKGVLASADIEAAFSEAVDAIEDRAEETEEDFTNGAYYGLVILRAAIEMRAALARATGAQA